MLPPEIVYMVLQFAIRGEITSGLLDVDLRSVARLCLVCREWNDLLQTSSLWEWICSAFPDFARLQNRQKAISQHWKLVCRERHFETQIREEVFVGDISCPAEKYLINISGTGSLSIGILNESRIAVGLGVNYTTHNHTQYETWSVYAMKTFSADFSDFWSMLGGVTPNNMTLNILGKFFDNCKPDLRFIDMSVFSPFVLLLTSDRQVIELMFQPDLVGSGEQARWTSMRTPRFVFEDVSILRVFSFDWGNAAIDINHDVWVWTALDHPFPEDFEERKKIQTNPVRLNALSDFQIVHIEPSFDPSVPGMRMYYSSDPETWDMSVVDETTFHIVSTEQIMSLMVEATFPQNVIDRLNNQLRV